MYGIQDTPSTAPPPKPLTFSEQLNWYFEHLWTLIWRVCSVENAHSPVGVLAMRRVGAPWQRFRALLERLKFGPLPPPPQRASPRPSTSPRALPAPGPVAKQYRGWLLHAVPQTGLISRMCYNLLLHAEAPALLAADPTFARGMRSLLWMLGHKVPPNVFPPLRPRAPRPKARKQRKRKPRPLVRIDYSRELYGMHRVPPDASWGLAPPSKKRS
jgi:hypothetical protein